VPPGRSREGWPHKLFTTFVFGFIKLVLKQWVLSPTCRQLFSIQGTIKFKGIRHEPIQSLPLLPHPEWLVFCTTHNDKAITTAKSHPFVIAVITCICVLSIPVRRVTTGCHTAEQLHAIFRPNAGHEEEVHPVLGCKPATFLSSPMTYQ